MPEACIPKGTRANGGAACVFNGQCSTGYCSGMKNALCGTCAAAPATDASCVSSNCGRDQLCDTGTLTCETPLALGGTCDADDSCGYGLSCPASGTAAARTCQPAVEDLGAACGGTKATCDGLQGLTCTGTAGAKTCAKIAYVGDGMPCGVLAAGGFAACIAGGCYTDKQLAGSGESGMCKADVTDGSPCDIVLGPGCQTPARCVVAGGAHAGTCTEPTGTACP